jgi:hypothetical protein
MGDLRRLSVQQRRNILLSWQEADVRAKDFSPLRFGPFEFGEADTVEGAFVQGGDVVLAFVQEDFGWR